MSHDSRYEKECPKHGWYFDEEGCAGCQVLEAKRFWTHKRVSYLKSGVRIKACILAALMLDAHTAVVVLALGLAAAEWLGVWEEWGARG